MISLILWIYAVTGSLYCLLWATGAEVVRHAAGPLWIFMVLAPVVLVALIGAMAARLSLVPR